MRRGNSQYFACEREEPATLNMIFNLQKLLRQTYDLREPINAVFLVALITLCFVIFGIVPRETIWLAAAILVLYFAFASLENAILLFVRFIPFFFALPILPAFDNFNIWRIAVLIIFMRWFFRKEVFARNLAHIKDPAAFFALLWRSKRIEFLGILLFILAIFSLVVADDLIVGLKRIIYFANLALIFIVLKNVLADKGGFDGLTASGFYKKVAANFILSGLIALLFGYFQWLSAYFVPAWMWHYWWGQVVSLGMYGKEWANIVTNFGNTWFSYSGGGLRLRMFSLFPDSHSFPLYLLMILPSLYLFLPRALLEKGFNGLWEGIIRNGKFFLVALFFIMGGLILSGTRGIWVSVVFPLALVSILWFLRKNLRTFLRPLFLVLPIFAVVFVIAFGVIYIPQFREDKAAESVFGARLSSLVDWNETSNKGRIEIWEKTARSIMQRPVFGVGIGNFPTILKENISASKAGASAHNLFLNIAAETGILSLGVFLWLIWELIKRARRHIFSKVEELSRIYALAFLFFLLWILGYSLTDAALFDERAFLGFMVMLALFLGLPQPVNTKS